MNQNRDIFLWNQTIGDFNDIFLSNKRMNHWMKVDEKIERIDF